jgi:nucleotide-binding universal stress UspA family protein
MSVFRRILVAFDGSPGSERALAAAIQLAVDQGAALVIISVVEHLPRFAGTVGEVDESVRERTDVLRRQQERAVRLAQEQDLATPKTLLVMGHAAQLIVRAAEEEQADLLALGRSGHSEVWGRFMGSTADKIARHAPCSVLIAQ